MRRPAVPGQTWLVGLAAALLVVVGVLTWVALDQRSQVEELRADDHADQEVLAAARRTALAFTNVDYKEVDDDVAAVLDSATEQFAAQFRSAAPQLKRLTRAARSVSEGKVVEAGLVSRDGDEARAIIVADTQVTNRSIKEAQPRYFRLQLDLVRQDDGQWLTRDLEFVG